MDWVATAVAAGLTPLVVWESTPAELVLVIEAFQHQLERQREQVITQAYLAAYWNRVKQMPTLKQALGQEDREQDLLSYIKELNAAMGGSVY